MCLYRLSDTEEICPRNGTELWRCEEYCSGGHQKKERKSARELLYEEARKQVLEVVETELTYCLENCDSEPLTLADFVADVQRGLETLLDRLEDEARERG